MPLPLPNLTDLKCAVSASMSSTVGSAVAASAIATLLGLFLPAAAIPLALNLKAASLAGAGALTLSSASAYPECQKQSNDAYNRDVEMAKEIGYCKQLEEGKLVVAQIRGRDVTLSEAAYYNQVPGQYRLDYERCIEKGYIKSDNPASPPSSIAPQIEGPTSSSPNPKYAGEWTMQVNGWVVPNDR